MAVWSKGYYSPATGTWHNIVAATADCKMSFCQAVNISPSESCRLVVAVGAAADLEISAPTGLSIQSVGGVGTVTYEYVVTAVKADGRETGPSGKVTLLSGYDGLDASNYNSLTWQEVTGAAKYRVYRRKGGEDSIDIAVVETTSLSYADKGGMSDGEKWPWVNMTGVVAVLAWCELAPGVGVEPISRPIPIANGDKIMMYTTGEISAFASGEA